MLVEAPDGVAGDAQDGDGHEEEPELVDMRDVHGSLEAQPEGEPVGQGDGQQVENRGAQAHEGRA
ncbi:hypothetical protein D3C86_2218000 [compost metagenome]